MPAWIEVLRIKPSSWAMWRKVPWLTALLCNLLVESYTNDCQDLRIVGNAAAQDFRIPGVYAKVSLLLIQMTGCTYQCGYQSG